MAGGEDGAGAGAREAGVEFHGGGNGRGHWDVGGGPEGAAEVADVAAHEDECFRGGAGETGDVADGVLGRDVSICSGWGQR